MYNWDKACNFQNMKWQQWSKSYNIFPTNYFKCKTSQNIHIDPCHNRREIFYPINPFFIKLDNQPLICIWTLRRLKNLKVGNDIILDVYNKEMRVILEFGVPIWNGNLTAMDSAKLENVQKKVFRLLLQEKYSSYDEACEVFKTKKLHDRRAQLCLNFFQ